MVEQTYTQKEVFQVYREEHKEIHRLLDEKSRRELELADAKFVKANEVREQIDRERGTYATIKELNAKFNLYSVLLIIAVIISIIINLKF